MRKVLEENMSRKEEKEPIYSGANKSPAQSSFIELPHNDHYLVNCSVSQAPLKNINVIIVEKIYSEVHLQLFRLILSLNITKVEMPAWK